jgi:catechol-2,3-dioxygenase
VSLSAYLRDPDLNGVELTWDRPAGSWFSEDGALRMGHRPITLEQLLAANRQQEPWDAGRPQAGPPARGGPEKAR